MSTSHVRRATGTKGQHRPSEGLRQRQGVVIDSPSWRCTEILCLIVSDLHNTPRSMSFRKSIQSLPRTREGKPATGHANYQEGVEGSDGSCLASHLSTFCSGQEKLSKEITAVGGGHGEDATPTLASRTGGRQRWRLRPISRVREDTHVSRSLLPFCRRFPGTPSAGSAGFGWLLLTFRQATRLSGCPGEQNAQGRTRFSRSWFGYRQAYQLARLEKPGGFPSRAMSEMIIE